jgi:hypothetical protein
MNKVRATVLQIIHDRRTYLLRQGQDERTGDLGPRDMERLCSPLDVIQGQRDDLARAKAVGGNEHEDRVVASPNVG